MKAGNASMCARQRPLDLRQVVFTSRTTRLRARSYLIVNYLGFFSDQLTYVDDLQVLVISYWGFSNHNRPGARIAPYGCKWKELRSGIYTNWDRDPLLVPKGDIYVHLDERVPVLPRDNQTSTPSFGRPITM
jgi:hypothetical protein